MFLSTMSSGPSSFAVVTLLTPMPSFIIDLLSLRLTRLRRGNFPRFDSRALFGWREGLLLVELARFSVRIKRYRLGFGW